MTFDRARLDIAAVAEVLAPWLLTQRWFAGKSRTATVTCRPLATLSTEPDHVEIWVGDATYEDGTVERYQIPLLFRSGVQEALEHSRIGSVVDADEAVIELYDALHDKEVTGLWLQGIADELVADPVTFVRTAAIDEIPLGSTSLVMSAQQSNTSLVFGDSAIMKVFRRIEPGLNPDIEIHDALSRLGDRHIARLLGYVSAEFDGETHSLAMVQEYMTTASDGWQLATTSVRDLMAEGDLHAEEAGGDFAGEAHRLGAATAAVHADLATAFGSTHLDASMLAERASQMHARLTAALKEVPALEPMAPALRATYDTFQDSGPVAAQRIHGDLHLGQVLRTVHRWVFLDFEGEPSKSIDERRQFDSPLRDVAGMLRSFDYAARHQLVDAGSTHQSEFRSAEWSTRNRDAFCRGYAEAGGVDPEEWQAVLAAFEADKAVYEAVYETRSRPGWLVIPLASLQRLATAEVTEV